MTTKIPYKKSNQVRLSHFQNVEISSITYNLEMGSAVHRDIDFLLSDKIYATIQKERLRST